MNVRQLLLLRAELLLLLLRASGECAERVILLQTGSRRVVLHADGLRKCFRLHEQTNDCTASPAIGNVRSGAHSKSAPPAVCACRASSVTVVCSVFHVRDLTGGDKYLEWTMHSRTRTLEMTASSSKGGSADTEL